ncbi:MAG TPA: methylamine utilization protein MauJ [Spirochaetia bacterium]|nr:methylamine utilization protein MauJ [Spirochaetia bacterium]
MANRRRKKVNSGSGAPLTSRSRKKDEAPSDSPLGQPPVTGRPIVTQEMRYTVVPLFPESDPRSKLGNGPIGAAGDYIVVYRLGVPGIQAASTEFHFGSLESTGDSLIEAHPDATQIVIELKASPDTPADQKLTLGVNREHRLSSVVLRCQAENFEGAAEHAHDIVMPFLSQLAFSHEVAITTTGREIIEVATETRQMSQITVGAVKGIALGVWASTPEQRRLLASYREGLSSSEPLYQALSFYKVVEGVLSMRGIEDAAHRARGETPNRAFERIPQDITSALHPSDSPLQRESFAPYLGRKFADVRDELRESLRNHISHMDFGALSFGADSYADVVAVQRALPVLRYMARVLLSSVVPVDNNRAGIS